MAIYTDTIILVADTKKELLEFGRRHSELVIEKILDYSGEAVFYHVFQQNLKALVRRADVSTVSSRKALEIARNCKKK